MFAQVLHLTSEVVRTVQMSRCRSCAYRTKLSGDRAKGPRGQVSYGGHPASLNLCIYFLGQLGFGVAGLRENPGFPRQEYRSIRAV